MSILTIRIALAAIAAFLYAIPAISQKQYDESLSPENIQYGLYYQTGPGSNNTLNWTYPYGSKITMNAGAYRNFELLTTHYPDGSLMLRQWTPAANSWTNWREVLVKKENGFLGLGIAEPQARLDVHQEMRLSSINERDNVYLRINRGDSGRDRALVSFGQGNEYVWHVGLLYRGGGANSDFFISQRSEIRDGNGNFVHTPDFTITQNGNVGIGSISPDAKLMVAGDIHASEVRLDLNGTVPPDYVFKEGYYLKSLKEVENHINEKGHLPNIPSAEEMEEEGINLKGMNLKLLEKIEELTLYTIQQQKMINEQNKRIEKIESLYYKNKGHSNNQ
ncbi:hypothetical protein [Galbibacter pacificus]|uniref:Uncharacterized protein n=1 Tax=Galbibacter pacificus TaxID=2996052 RepID=A0ABT6FN93_9FLAO|nr:hypothetical protein [Galbibacter pacificus]MDG3581256.1 hypothetical protein [Galbibacter pacificus]MDG3584734.1 hypothetical protein [Galbibacter pacificus]